MKAYIVIKDDNGDIQAEAEFDAGQPYAFRQPSTKKLVASMPQNSDNAATGSYELFGFSYQPHVRVERPNGWKEPPPTPWAGTPAARPNNGQPKAFGSILMGGGMLNPSAQRSLEQGHGLASSPNPISRG